MVTKSPTTHLLNKFSQLFNKSGAGDSDSEPHPDYPSTSSGQAVSERTQMLKRREDTVRAAELRQLRSIIQQRRAGEGRAAPNPGQARPRNSRAGALERNSLLDKIDGAEAHHVQQWWGTGPAALTPQSLTGPRSAVPEDDDLELDFTGLLALSADAPLSAGTDSAPITLQNPQDPLTPLQRCLRDAALHYAEGEFGTAEGLLTEMLAAPDTESESAEALIFALFDVYRCSNQQDRFDALALDYAQRFGRSPGEWYAIADPVAGSTSEDAKRLDAQRAKQTFWRCPARLDQAAWADCIAHHPADSQVFSINWLPLQHINAALAPDIARQVADWRDSPVELQWVGLETLLDALRMCRLGGDKSTNAIWWLIQLDLLCMAQQPEAFEELALEYCVALELSPPSWKPVACKLVQADDVPLPADFVATLPSAPDDSDTQALLPWAVQELSGNITGGHSQALSALALASRPAGQLAISCSRLGRIDLEAGVALRDWLQDCKARHCEVLFTHLPRLVLVYFQALGIQELAGISAGSR